MFELMSLVIGAALVTVTWVASLDAWRSGMKSMSVLLLFMGVVSMLFFTVDITSNIVFVVIAVLPGVLYFLIFREKENKVVTV